MGECGNPGEDSNGLLDNASFCEYSEFGPEKCIYEYRAQLEEINQEIFSLKLKIQGVEQNTMDTAIEYGSKLSKLRKKANSSQIQSKYGGQPKNSGIVLSRPDELKALKDQSSEKASKLLLLRQSKESADLIHKQKAERLKAIIESIKDEIIVASEKEEELKREKSSLRTRLDGLEKKYLSLQDESELLDQGISEEQAELSRIGRGKASMLRMSSVRSSDD